MQVKQRARSKIAKSERENSILVAAEMLLRQTSYDAMTMQAVATAASLAKGTLYLYFASRESLIIAVYGRLFDRWIDRFVVSQSEQSCVDGFCRDFARCYADDPLFLQLAGVANTFLEPHLDHAAYIVGRQGMIRRVKRLSGRVSQQFGVTPVDAQKLIWGLLTIAGGAAQLSVQSPFAKPELPSDIASFNELAHFETVFFNVALPFGRGIIQIQPPLIRK